MAGAAAGDYVFGISRPASKATFRQATKAAHAMAALYGMSDVIGPVAIGEKPGEVFIGRDLANTGNAAAVSLELVDSETRKFVTEAEQTAKAVLAINAHILDDLSNARVERETLTGAPLNAWPRPLLKGLNGSVAAIFLCEVADDSICDAATE